MFTIEIWYLWYIQYFAQFLYNILYKIYLYFMQILSSTIIWLQSKQKIDFDINIDFIPENFCYWDHFVSNISTTNILANLF